VLLGRVQDQGSEGCIFVAQNRLVATIGLERIIVVDTRMPLWSATGPGPGGQRPGGGVAPATAGGVGAAYHGGASLGPLCSHGRGASFKVKRIVVDPGKKLSLQVHQHRAEHWVVVSGSAQVTLGQEVRLVASNQSVYIPEDPHRLENPTVEPSSLSRSRPGPTWKKTISSVWRMTTGTRIRSKEQEARPRGRIKRSSRGPSPYPTQTLLYNLNDPAGNASGGQCRLRHQAQALL